MDYTPLVKAIQKGDQEVANQLISKARPILIRMLMVRMNASRDDAEDAVQKMFLYVIRAIREDRIKNPSGLLSYMIVTCRHNYLKKSDGVKTEPIADRINEPAQEPTQLTRIIDDEKHEIFLECLKSLKKEHYEFIRYWIDYPASSASEVADKFGISVNNAWTRKHRILKTIQKCIESKL